RGQRLAQYVVVLTDAREILRHAAAQLLLVDANYEGASAASTVRALTPPAGGPSPSALVSPVCRAERQEDILSPSMTSHTEFPIGPGLGAHAAYRRPERSSQPHSLIYRNASPRPSRYRSR